jgi:hypothetical protein
MVVLLVAGLVAVALPVAAAPADAPAGRARQLERAARDLTVRLRAVPVRDGDFADPGRYCPADRLAVSWAPPAGGFRFGAYIPPLGPAPGPATTSVNGVVTCRGATYAYMGFEARWTTGGWRVVDVPALDEPAPAPAAGRPARPGEDAPLAAAALSVALVALLLPPLRASHPPAGATTLLVSLGLLDEPGQLAWVLAGVVLLTAIAWALNRLAGVPVTVRQG